MTLRQVEEHYFNGLEDCQLKPNWMRDFVEDIHRQNALVNMFLWRTQCLGDEWWRRLQKMEPDNLPQLNQAIELVKEMLAVLELEDGEDITKVLNAVVDTSDGEIYE